MVFYNVLLFNNLKKYKIFNSCLKSNVRRKMPGYLKIFKFENIQLGISIIILN